MNTMTNAQTPQPNPADVIQWLENNHTLHRKVEALYVVDGYQVEITHDDVRIAGPWHGKTLFDAYAKGMAAGVAKESDVVLESFFKDIHDVALVAHAKRINRHIEDVDTDTRCNRLWSLALVRAGYAAGAQAAIDLNAPVANETWIVAKEHVWEHGDGRQPTLAYLLPSEFGPVTHASFEAASAFIKEGGWPLGFMAMQLDAPIPAAQTGH